MLDKIEAMSIQGRVYQRLKSALIIGFFEPGQELVIRELAEQLGTSAMPIRQSVSRLVSEHALEEDAKPRSSVRVPRLSAERFEDLRQMRCLVESEAAARAATRIDAAGLAQLKRLNLLITQAVNDGDVSATLTANHDFHFALYRYAGSLALLRVIESLWLQSGPYFRVLVRRYFEDRPGEPMNTNAHPQLLEALAKKDVDGARAALQADIEQAASYFTGQSEAQIGLKPEGTVPTPKHVKSRRGPRP